VQEEKEEEQEGGGRQEEVQEEKEEALIMARRRALMLFASLALAAALLPATARAETRTFVNNTDLFTKDGTGIFGPAIEYPSSTVVSGVPGTVTKATVTVLTLGSGNADDIDMMITGPNGQTVMLMSDACGAGLAGEDWTFDDAAPSFLSDNGPCANNQTASFQPSNFGGDPLSDDMNVAPQGAPNAPAPPYLNKLSFLAGGSPNGSWDLFVRDDDPMVFGFSIDAWVLTLDVQPAATQPSNPPATATTVPAPAKKKCKKKKHKKAAAAKKCKKKKKKKR
jgi:hypothetical protein